MLGTPRYFANACLLLMKISIDGDGACGMWRQQKAPGWILMEHAPKIFFEKTISFPLHVFSRAFITGSVSDLSFSCDSYVAVKRRDQIVNDVLIILTKT